MKIRTMPLVVSVFQFFLACNLYAITEKDAIKAAIDISQTAQKGAGDGSCYKCGAMSVDENKNDPFCKNAFDNTCLNQDGTSKFEGSYSENSKVLRSKLLESRDMASREMGQKSFKELLTNQLKDNGILIEGELSEDQMLRLLQENWDTPSVPDVIFPDVKTCEKTNVQDVLIGGNYDYVKSAALHKAKVDSAKAKQLEMNAKDIPNFLSTEYTGSCNSIKSSPEKYPEKYNKEIIQKCKNFPLIFEKAVELYRQEGSSDYDIKALAFVKENQLPVIFEKPTPEDEIIPGKIEYNAYRNQGYQSCNNLKSAITSATQKVTQSLVLDIAKSKNVVEHMIDSYYSPERKTTVLEIFNSSKNDIKELLPRITKDSKKLEKIAKGYDQVKLAWLEKPQESLYEKSKKTGLTILKENPDYYDEVAMAFSDPRLSYFTEINAFYTPIIMEGQDVAAIDTVHMMPYFLKTAENNKYGFMSVVAHEAGHKIGPMVSKANGHDLNPEWQELIDCYRSSDSIKLSSNQKDETIADYIASEVLAKEIEKLNPSDRREAFKNSMSAFCIFSDASICNHIMALDEAHPENIFRINGIYAANPKLREVIGCSGISSNYKSCSLK
jgi:hypothetical protein